MLTFFHLVNGALLQAKVQSLRAGFVGVNNELAHEAPNEYLFKDTLLILTLSLLSVTLGMQIFMDKVSAFLAIARPKIEEVGKLTSAMDKAYLIAFHFFFLVPLFDDTNIYQSPNFLW